MKVKDFKKMVKKIDSKYDDYDLIAFEKGSVYNTSPKDFTEHPYDKKNDIKTLTLNLR